MSARSAPASVLVFGSINTDLVVYLPRLPHPGETVSGGTYSSFPGGKGANAAVAASRSGAPVKVFGAVGEDSFGSERIRSLREEGIDVEGIVVKQGSRSGVAQIWVDARGENSIAVAPGANALFATADVPALPMPEGERGVAAFQNEVPQETTEALIRACKRLGYTTVWNVAPECRRRPERATLADTDFLVFNEREIRSFIALLASGDAPPAPGAEKAALLGPIEAEALAAPLIEDGSRDVLVTIGRAGSVWVNRSGGIHQPAFEVEAVDTVGAGDCFCGVFAASLAQGLTPRAAMERAAAAAAISVTRRGAQTSMPLGAEIDEFLRGRKTRAGR